MGLFDAILGQAGSALSGGTGGAPPGLMVEIAGLLGNGGLQDLLARFQQHGLGDTAASWIGTGSNLPVSAEQIHAVLGSAQVQALAAKLGLPPDTAAQLLAQVLPQAVDHLTPDGQPPSDDALQRGLSVLKGLGL